MIEFEQRWTVTRPWWLWAAAAFIGLAVGLLPLDTLLLGAGTTAVLGGVLLALVQPLWAVTAVLFIGPTKAWVNEYTPLGGLPLDVGQLTLPAAFGVWGLYWLARRRPTLPHHDLLWPLGIFLAVAGLSLLDAISLGAGLTELLKWIEIGLLIWLVLDVTVDWEPHTAVTVVLVMVLAPAVAQAGMGIWQFGRGDGPESFIILDQFYRAYGTFEQPNPFGGYMGINGLLAGGVLLGLLQDWWRRGRIHWGWLVGIGACTAVLGLALVMSWSRGAWLGAAAGGTAVAFLWPRRRRDGVLLLTVGLAAVLVAGQIGLIPAAVTDRISSAEEFQLQNLRDIELTQGNYALLERLAFWQAAGEMARSDLWLGVGFGNYDAAYGLFAPEGWPTSLGHAHNYYLNLLAEIGILGLGAYVLFWAIVVGQGVRLLNRTHGRWRGIALGLIGAWVALTVHHLVDKLYVNNLYLHFGVLLALQQLLTRIPQEKFD